MKLILAFISALLLSGCEIDHYAVILAIDAKDYPASFTASDRQRLRTIFPGGVCDWSKPGVEQQPMAGTWQSIPASLPNTATR